MSQHEKGGNKKMPTPRHKVIRNPIPVPSRPQHIIMQTIGCQGCLGEKVNLFSNWRLVLLSLLYSFITKM